MQESIFKAGYGAQRWKLKAPAIQWLIPMVWLRVVVVWVESGSPKGPDAEVTEKWGPDHTGLSASSFYFSQMRD